LTTEGQPAGSAYVLSNENWLFEGHTNVDLQPPGAFEIDMRMRPFRTWPFTLDR
jgi:hypothetical protein